MLIFAVMLGWLPSSGIANPLGWIMPIATIGLTSSASLMRNTRSSLLEIIRQDYITTAWASGVRPFGIYMKHALKNALIPILNIFGGQLCLQLGGSLMAESVFSVPGLGKYMLDAIAARDFPVVQGGVIVVAFVASLIMLLVDILYTLVDPRVKTHFTRKKPKKRIVSNQHAKEGSPNG
jgi:peptide/nickel transport system permease protein